MMAYYGNNTHPGAHFNFNFNLVNSPNSAQDFNSLVHQWVDNIPEKKQSVWMVGGHRGLISQLLVCEHNYKLSNMLQVSNHDNPRVAKRYKLTMVDSVYMLVTLLPGTAATISMTDLVIESKPTARIRRGRRSRGTIPTVPVYYDTAFAVQQELTE
jgi:hypothetical protein